MTDREREEMNRGTSEVFDNAGEIIKKYKTSSIPYTIGSTTAMIYLLSMILESMYGKGDVAVKWAAKGMRLGTNTIINLKEDEKLTDKENYENERWINDSVEQFREGKVTAHELIEVEEEEEEK